jgi:hypothetical protein
MWKIMDWGFCFMRRHFRKSSEIAEIRKQKSKKGRKEERQSLANEIRKEGRKNETTDVENYTTYHSDCITYTFDAVLLSCL